MDTDLYRSLNFRQHSPEVEAFLARLGISEREGPTQTLFAIAVALLDRIERLEKTSKKEA